MLIIGAAGDSAGDWSAEQVAAQLAHRGVPHAWIDTGDFPQRLGLAAELGDAGWVRAVAGAARWINHPSALADAEYKPRQLATARRLGMAVPPTLITNRAEAVRDFAARHGDLVVKPLAEPIVEEAGSYTAVWTRRLAPADLRNLDGVDATAHLFQQWVPKRFEVRLTAVGDRLFPVSIPAGSDAARVDWRSDYDALIPPSLTTTTPAPVRRARKGPPGSRTSPRLDAPPG